MRRIIDSDLLTLLVRVTLGVVFVYASFYKILEPAEFAKSICYYHMVPGKLINLMALILPWLELIVGLGLIFGFYYRGSVLLVNLMIVMFIVALASAIDRGLNIKCGCFEAGGAATTTAENRLYQDLLLLVGGIQLWVSRSRAWQVMPQRKRR